MTGRAPSDGNRLPGHGQSQLSDGSSGSANRHSGKPTKPPKPPTMVGQAAKFVFMPEIGRSLESVKFAWQLLVNLVAQIYVGVGLIPKDHPCLNLRNASQYKLQDIIKIAYQSLKWEREYIPQIIIFFAVIAFLFFITLSAIVFVFGTVIHVAHADTTNNSNGANEILTEIFNSQAGIIPSALGEMLRVYSNTVLVLAGIILIYHIFHYVVESARHGQAGGKGFNHSWAPVRLVFALGLLVPLSSGLNSGQYIALYLAKWGSQMATLTYQKFNSYMGMSNDLVQTQQYKIDATKPFQDLFQVYVCESYYNTRNPGSITIQTTTVPGEDNIHELNFSGNTLGNPGCGTIRYYYNSSPSSNSEKLRNKSWELFSSNVAAIKTDAVKVASVFDPQSNNYGQAIDQSGVKTDIDNIANQYDSAVESASIDAATAENAYIQSQNNSFAQNSLNWLDAPTQIYEFAKDTSEITSAAHSTPTVTAQSTDLSNLVLGGTQIAQDSGGGNPLDIAGNAIKSMGSKLMDFVKGILSTLNPALAIQAANPFGALISYGINLMAVGSGLLSTWVVLAASAGITQGSGVAAIEALNPAITFCMGLFFLPGIQLALVLPFIPALRFIFAVLGWVVMVIIAVMGVPLFALAHLKTGGEGWIGQLQVASAYNMIIGIIIRPTLIVIGFFIGMLLFNTYVSLAGKILFGSMVANAGAGWLSHAGGLSVTAMVTSGGAGIIGTIIFWLITFGAITTMFTSLSMGVANACFKLVDIIPSQAMTWMGTGPMSSPTEDGTNEIMSETRSQTLELGKNMGGILTSERAQKYIRGEGQRQRNARNQIGVQDQDKIDQVGEKLDTDRAARNNGGGGDNRGNSERAQGAPPRLAPPSNSGNAANIPSVDPGESPDQTTGTDNNRGKTTRAPNANSGQPNQAPVANNSGNTTNAPNQAAGADNNGDAKQNAPEYTPSPFQRALKGRGLIGKWLDRRSEGPSE